MKKLLYILFLLLPLSLLSQNVSFKATAPRQVQEGQRFSIQYIVSANKYADKLILPDFKNLKVITTSKGTGTNTSVTIINGKMKSQSTYTTSWNVYVEAGKVGNVTILPATATVDGKKYKSNSLTISIVKSSGKQQNNSGNFSNQTSPQEVFSDPEPSYNTVFFNITLNKTEVYQGEPVFLNCRLFIQPRYQVQMEDFKPPSFDKIWSKQIDIPKQPQLKRVLFNNKTYLSAVIDKRLLFPQSSGELTIPAYSGTFSLYDSWGFPIGDKSIKSSPKKIRVKPLPQKGKPQNFSGAVGNFKVEYNIDNSEVKVNDPVNFEIKIKGTGNFGIFDVPQITLPKTFEALNPEEKDNLHISESGISGTKTITYSFIARVPGNYKIPPFSFSYFDYNDKKYHTVVSDTFNIKVTGSSNTSTALNTNNVEQEIGKDIRFIKTGNTNLKPKNNFIFNSNWTLLFVYFGIIVLFLIIMFILRKKIKENADLRTVKFKQANKISRKRLKKAHSFMIQEKKDNFYEEILNALWGYVSDKLNLNESELTRDNLKSVFVHNNIDESLQNDFINLIDKVETSRYAPVDVQQNMNNIYNDAAELINKFEKLIIKS